MKNLLHYHVHLVPYKPDGPLLGRTCICCVKRVTLSSVHPKDPLCQGKESLVVSHLLCVASAV